MKTGVPAPTSLIRAGEYREMSRNQKLFWENRMMEYVKREMKLDGIFQKTDPLIFGQCTNNMQSNLEAQKYYHNMRGYYYLFLLVEATEGITFKFSGHKHPYHSLYDTKSFFCRYYHTGQTKTLGISRLSLIRCRS